MRKTLKALLAVIAFMSVIPLSYAADPALVGTKGGLDPDSVTVDAPSGPFTADPYAGEYVLVGNEYSGGGEFYIPSNEDGTFGASSPVDSYGNVDGLVIADFDNDGDLDFILGNGNLGEAYLYENVGAGTFTPTTVATEILLYGYWSQFRAGDIDNDGWVDWVGGDFWGAKWWFRNNHDGSFTDNTLDVSWHDGALCALDVGDFNNDGNDDIAMMDLYGASCKVRLYIGDGAGGFTHSQVINFTADSGGATSASGLAAGDFNGDGKLDLVVGGDYTVNPGLYYLYLGDGAGAFTLQGPVFDIGGAQGAVDAFDIDHDGNMDVVGCNWAGGECRFVKGNGDGTFQIPVLVEFFELYVFSVAAPYAGVEPVGGTILPANLVGFACSALVIIGVFTVALSAGIWTVRRRNATA